MPDLLVNKITYSIKNRLHWYYVEDTKYNSWQFGSSEQGNCFIEIAAISMSDPEYHRRHFIGP